MKASFAHVNEMMVLGFRLVGAGEITQIEEDWFAESHVKQLVQTRNYSNIFKLKLWLVSLCFKFCFDVAICYKVFFGYVGMDQYLLIPFLGG